MSAGHVFSAELPGKTFAAMCARAAGIAPAAAKIPIVAHALLRAEGDSVAIAATNLDQALTMTGGGEGRGAVTASAAKLSAVAARMDPDAPVKLAATATQLTVSQGRALYRLPALAADDFPESLTAPLNNADVWQAPAAALAANLAALEGCIDPKDQRFYLAGVFFDLEGDEPCMVATDGHAMGTIRIDGMSPPKRSGVILPVEAFRPIAEIARTAETLELCLSDSAVTVEGGAARLRTKLVAGTYPAWRRVVPGGRKTRVRVQAALFERLLSRVGIVEGDVEKERGKRAPSAVRLDIGKDEIVATSANSAGEEAIDACEATRIAGEDVSVGLQTRLVSWAAASLGDAEELELGVEEASEPVTLTRAGDDDRHSLRIIMPMRI